MKRLWFNVLLHWDNLQCPKKCPCKLHCGNCCWPDTGPLPQKMWSCLQPGRDALHSRDCIWTKVQCWPEGSSKMIHPVSNTNMSKGTGLKTVKCKRYLLCPTAVWWMRKPISLSLQVFMINTWSEKVSHTDISWVPVEIHKGNGDYNISINV